MKVKSTKIGYHTNNLTIEKLFRDFIIIWMIAYTVICNQYLMCVSMASLKYTHSTHSYWKFCHVCVFDLIPYDDHIPYMLGLVL